MSRQRERRGSLPLNVLSPTSLIFLFIKHHTLLISRLLAWRLVSQGHLPEMVSALFPGEVPFLFRFVDFTLELFPNDQPAARVPKKRLPQKREAETPLRIGVL